MHFTNIYWTNLKGQNWKSQKLSETIGVNIWIRLTFDNEEILKLCLKEF